MRSGAVALVFGTRPELVKLAPLVHELGDAASPCTPASTRRPAGRHRRAISGSAPRPSPARPRPTPAAPPDRRRGRRGRRRARPPRARRRRGAGRHQLHARRGARRVGARPARSSTSRPGCARSTGRCPRSATASSSTISPTCCARRPRPRAPTCSPRAATPTRVVGHRQHRGRRGARGRGPDPAPPPRVLARHGVAADALRARHVPPPGERRRPRAPRARSSTSSRRSPLPVVLTVHPRTRDRAARAGIELGRGAVRAVDPLGFRDFLALESACAFLVSDSGGVQEEASIVGRPVLVARRSTERPEVLGHVRHPRGPRHRDRARGGRARGRRRRRAPPARRSRLPVRRRPRRGTAIAAEIAARFPGDGGGDASVRCRPWSTRCLGPGWLSPRHAPSRPARSSPRPARCCICRTRDSEPVGVGPDFEYRTSPDSFLAVRCTRCGVVYLDRRPVAAELDRIYPDHYHAFAFTEDRFGFVYSVRRRLEARRLLHAFAGLPADARIVDVGCGDGFHLDLLDELRTAGVAHRGRRRRRPRDRRGPPARHHRAPRSGRGRSTSPRRRSTARC